ncbi:MAG: flavodoxin [Candidatus Aureabacteria bacterium]|nr:flavodoxin [Candidatus Auribacterota bacterium]
MRRLILPVMTACLIFMALPVQMCFAAEEAGKGPGKILVAYFSHTGNTREIAGQIQKITGGDLFEIRTVKPYPEDYDTVVEQARKELDSGSRPELKTKVENIGQYDVIFIGYPNWWSTFPAPVRVFLTDNDFTGKTIVPFCTHGGGGLGKSVTHISEFCPDSTLLDAFSIPGTQVKNAEDKVAEWLRTIGIMQ